jgi:hypothetical protein
LQEIRNIIQVEKKLWDYKRPERFFESRYSAVGEVNVDQSDNRGLEYPVERPAIEISLLMLPTEQMRFHLTPANEHLFSLQIVETIVKRLY